MENYYIHKLSDLKSWVEKWLAQISSQDQAQVVRLRGDLGSGKTALVKEAAYFFGIEETLTSPTFVILKEYDIKKETSPFRKLIHIDAYRLKNKEELEYLGWKELIANPSNIIFLEWPEMVEGIKAPKAIDIELEIMESETRKLSYQKS